MRPPYLPPSFATHPFNGFLLLRCNLDVVDGCPLVPSSPHVSNFWGISPFSHRLVEHLDEPLLMLTDLLRGEEGTRTLRRSCSSAFCRQTQRGGAAGWFGCYLQQLRVLPAELLQQSWEQRRVPLDGLSHVQKLGLSSQERQRILT